MIKYINKNITSIQYGVVAHGVNCRSVMGSGVALAIKNKWAVVYKEYLRVCHNQPKDLLGLSQAVEITPDELYVMNCFTQLTYGNDGRKYADLSAVSDTISHIASFAAYKQLPVYIPKIGCKRGGLSWDNEVKSILESIAEEYPELEFYVVDI